MASSCTAPLAFYRALELDGTPMENIQLTLKKPENMDGYEKIKMPCGKCAECRKAQSREWAVRCCLEMQMHEQNTFLTLTYDDENLPWNGGLDKVHLSLFLKRLRKHIAENSPQTWDGIGDKHDPESYHDKRIRFFACGEYGERLSRPHYHLIIFGYDFTDKEFHSKNSDEDSLYTSETLKKIWGLGHCLIGDATSGSANYIAGYVAKKENGVKAEKHYEKFDPDTGEITSVIPEFLTMSTTPGIGYNFYTKYKKDIFPSDEIILTSKNNAVRCPVPYFFYRKLRLEEPELFQQVQAARLKKGKEYSLLHPDENSPERLQTKAFINRKAKLSKVRPLEGEQIKNSVDMTDIYTMQKNMANYDNNEKNREIFQNLFSSKNNFKVSLNKDIDDAIKIIKIDEY